MEIFGPLAMFAAIMHGHRWEKGLEVNVMAGGPWTYDTTPVESSEDANYIPMNGTYINTAQMIDILVLR